MKNSLENTINHTSILGIFSDPVFRTLNTYIQGKNSHTKADHICSFNLVSYAINKC